MACACGKNKTPTQREQERRQLAEERRARREAALAARKERSGK